MEFSTKLELVNFIRNKYESKINVFNVKQFKKYIVFKRENGNYCISVKKKGIKIDNNKFFDFVKLVFPEMIGSRSMLSMSLLQLK